MVQHFSATRLLLFAHREQDRHGSSMILGKLEQVVSGIDFLQARAEHHVHLALPDGRQRREERTQLLPVLSIRAVGTGGGGKTETKKQPECGEHILGSNVDHLAVSLEGLFEEINAHTLLSLESKEGTRKNQKEKKGGLHFINGVHFV
jgi:hypothetical protein